MVGEKDQATEGELREFLEAGRTALINIAHQTNREVVRLWTNSPKELEQVFKSVLWNPILIGQIQPSVIPADGKAI